MAAFRSSEPHRTWPATAWRAVDYCLVAIIVAFCGFVMFMALHTITQGWSAHP